MTGLSLLTRGYINNCSIEQIVKQVPLSPDQGQSLLTKALELPLPKDMTEVNGIFQPDIIIRTAIVAGIANLRAEPWLMKYVFASLPKDPLTNKEYGEKEVGAAKDWFRRTDIPVTMDYKLDALRFPCVTIRLKSSKEAEKTLGDVHYEPFEDLDDPWPAFTNKFTPERYSPSSGIMVVPEAIAESLVISEGMVIVDRYGKTHEIIEIFDKTSFSLDPGTVADFKDCVIKGARPSYGVSLESRSFREAYTIGCHAMGESTHLTYLHSIVKFVLLRGQQHLLEARGFERVEFSSGSFDKNAAFKKEDLFSRFIEISGYVRNSWPKAIRPKTASIDTAPVGLIGVQNSVGEDPSSTTETFIGIDDEADSLG